MKIRKCSDYPIALTYVFPEHDFAYIGVPKCGTYSMRQALFPNKMDAPALHVEEALPFTTRMAIIRHPLDRVFSAWNHIWPSHEFGVWWEHVKKNPYWDAHTAPYTSILNAVPNEIYALEDWDKWWPVMATRYPGLFPETMPWRNYSERLFELDDYRQYHEEILEVYADDLVLFNEARLDEPVRASGAV